MDYFHRQGLDVMAFQDYYPDGHQGGVTLVQNGARVAANGDLRLEPMPGQWSPIPKKGSTVVDRNTNTISTTLWYPDSSKNRTGFNPIEYPDLTFSYQVHTHVVDHKIIVTVDLDKPLPDEWYGKVGFNIELFPEFYFGKRYYMDGRAAMFTRQANVIFKDAVVQPLAVGKVLTIVPDAKEETIRFSSTTGEMYLYDGRALFNNGWFVVRTLAKKGSLKNAVVLEIDASCDPDFLYPTIAQVSQVGYLSNAPKQVIFERDHNDQTALEVVLQKVLPEGKMLSVKEGNASDWGDFLRYKYQVFDFSEIRDPGLYQIRYHDKITHAFAIGPNVYDVDVWQPTLAYYLPVQMCHMRINDRYKVWHGLCHDDDALMAPIDLNHFDGYVQGSSTLCEYPSGAAVPGLNHGGWHDAGDYDLRVESQAGTVQRLAEIYELFKPEYDGTSIDQKQKVVEMLRPDGVPDILQQIEHGVLSVVGGYQALGRIFRGIICADLRQYTLLGDASVMTDNQVYQPASNLPMDDRWVFTEENPRRELYVASCMATASRVLSGYNDMLAKQTLVLARDYWQRYKETDQLGTIALAVELYRTTRDQEYLDFIFGHQDKISENLRFLGPVIARIIQQIDNPVFQNAIHSAMVSYAIEVKEQVKETPYGVAYKPNIWGAGWGIQTFGYNQYFLHKGFPDLFDKAPVFSALQFILGVHPGENTASFASGVGTNSLTVAYGVNRDEWSYIPGGSASGTALIRPDLPELKNWPYFWQQTEYVMGGGATNFMFLVLAARELSDE
ncbi:MAG: glycoside hydrolase family 9 protein [Saprospiraceae bacterium]|nr:glycoside hydrolase family 9 protein [Saprospiraceae bacterium]